MEDYEVYPSERLVLVDHIPCTELDAYEVNELTGSNDVEGRFFLSRGSQRHLYRLDIKTGAVTEIQLP